MSLSHSCPGSVSKGVKEAPQKAVRGDGFPEKELHVGATPDFSSSRGTLRNYNACLPYEARYQIIRTRFKVSQPEVKC